MIILANLIEFVNMFSLEEFGELYKTSKYVLYFFCFILNESIASMASSISILLPTLTSFVFFFSGLLQEGPNSIFFKVEIIFWIGVYCVPWSSCSTICSFCIQVYFMFIQYNINKVLRNLVSNPPIPLCFVDFTSPCSYVTYVTQFFFCRKAERDFAP